MLRVASGTMADVAKMMYPKYELIYGKFQDNVDKIKNVLRIKLSSTSSRYASLVIEDSLFCLTKGDWDKENDMWKLKEFEDLFLIFKILHYSLIPEFVVL